MNMTPTPTGTTRSPLVDAAGRDLAGPQLTIGGAVVTWQTTVAHLRSLNEQLRRDEGHANDSKKALGVALLEARRCLSKHLYGQLILQAGLNKNTCGAAVRAAALQEQGPDAILAMAHARLEHAGANVRADKAARKAINEGPEKLSASDLAHLAKHPTEPTKPIGELVAGDAPVQAADAGRDGDRHGDADPDDDGWTFDGVEVEGADELALMEDEHARSGASGGSGAGSTPRPVAQNPPPGAPVRAMPDRAKSDRPLGEQLALDVIYEQRDALRARLKSVDLDALDEAGRQAFGRLIETCAREIEALTRETNGSAA